MGLLDEIVASQGGSAVDKLAGKFGLNKNQVQDALGQLLPGLGKGVKRNLDNSKGLDELLATIKSNDHSRYLDDPEQLDNPDATVDGDGILGHILGDKQSSRDLAGKASQKTGIDSGILKKMLPLVAQLVMGVLGKQAANNGMLGTGFSAGSGRTNPLISLLDSDGDGSIIDDIIRLVMRFLRR